jgi:hypothetical protein
MYHYILLYTTIYYYVLLYTINILLFTVHILNILYTIPPYIITITPQVFVEALDKCFENVCELDLIFHSDKVNYILDEIIMAGMVLETNINHILSAVQEQSNLHTASIQMLHNASAAQIQMSSAASHATDIGGKIFSSISGSFAN